MTSPSEVQGSASDSGQQGRAFRGGRGSIRIHTTGDDPTVRFAGEELERVLCTMSGATAVHVPNEDDGLQPETLILTCGPASGAAVLPAVEDPTLDDAIAIDVRSRQGIIAGTNPRAVLIATYRYLTELGCRWVRPGTDGEIIPAVDAGLHADLVLQPVGRRESPIDVRAESPPGGFDARRDAWGA